MAGRNGPWPRTSAHRAAPVGDGACHVNCERRESPLCRGEEGEWTFFPLRVTAAAADPKRDCTSSKPERNSVGPSKYELQGPTVLAGVKRRLQLTGRPGESQRPVTGRCGELPHRMNPQFCPSRALPCGSA
jgi:hypothetical protein